MAYQLVENCINEYTFNQEYEDDYNNDCLSLIPDNDFNPEKEKEDEIVNIKFNSYEEPKEVLYESKKVKNCFKENEYFKTENQYTECQYEDKINNQLIINPSTEPTDNENCTKKPAETNTYEINNGYLSKRRIQLLKLPVPEECVIKNESNKVMAIKNNEYKNKNRKLFKVFYVFNYRNKNEEKLKLIRREIERFTFNFRKKIKRKYFIFSLNIKNQKIQRKFKPDNIRKKIKSHFFKYLIKIVNKLLFRENSKKKFKWQQCFIKAITRKTNDSKILNMTFKELITTDFTKSKTFLKYVKNKDINYYKENMIIIKYLEENEHIRKKSNFDFISNMTYRDLFNEYIESKEFEEDISRLKKKYVKTYVKKYIINAYKFIEYFSKSK